MLFFSEFACSGRVWTEFWTKIFFSLSAYIIPVLTKNNAANLFFNFLNFFAIFFRNFPPQVEYERNSGLNFFSLFPDLSHPVLAKNNAGKRFFNFLNFFAIFFGIFLPGSRMSRIWDYNFFFPFLGLSNVILTRNKAKKRFIDFLNFFAIFFGIFFPGSSINGFCD